MTTRRGHFDGRVVVLDEPPPVAHTIDVEVRFPEAGVTENPGSARKLIEQWRRSRARIPELPEGVVDAVLDELRGGSEGTSVSRIPSRW